MQCHHRGLVDVCAQGSTEVVAFGSEHPEVRPPSRHILWGLPSSLDVTGWAPGPPGSGGVPGVSSVQLLLACPSCLLGQSVTEVSLPETHCPRGIVSGGVSPHIVTAQLPLFVHVDPGVSETLVVSSTAPPCPSLGRQEACAVSLRCAPHPPFVERSSFLWCRSRFSQEPWFLLLEKGI